MNKQEFLDRLGTLLSCLPASRVAESQAFYAEAIADRMEEGMTEEEAVAALGSPGAVADAILDEMPPVPRVMAKTRRRSTVLLWALIIVGSPLWLALLLTFALVALGGVPVHLDARRDALGHCGRRGHGPAACPDPRLRRLDGGQRPLRPCLRGGGAARGGARHRVLQRGALVQPLSGEAFAEVDGQDALALPTRAVAGAFGCRRRDGLRRRRWLRAVK